MDYFNTIVHQIASNPALIKILWAAAAILVLFVLVRVIRRSFTRRIKEADTRYRAHKMVAFLGYVLGIFVISVIYREQLGALTLALGVAGAGVAFAMQEVIASVAGWVAISLGSFYKTGDRVQLGGIKGDVIDIGVLRTTLMEIGEWISGDQYNGRIVRVANSFVFKEPVFNYSGDFPFLWDEITLPLSHGSSVETMKRIMENAMLEVVGDYVDFARGSWKTMVEKYLIENASVEPAVALSADNNAMYFTARYVVDYKKRRSMKDRIFARLLEDIEKTDGRVSLATSTLALVQAPPLEVRLNEGGKSSSLQ
jgi:small-conductance mechanosensitive channel